MVGFWIEELMSHLCAKTIEVHFSSYLQIVFFTWQNWLLWSLLSRSQTWSKTHAFKRNICWDFWGGTFQPLFPWNCWTFSTKSKVISMDWQLDDDANVFFFLCCNHLIFHVGHTPALWHQLWSENVWITNKWIQAFSFRMLIFSKNSMEKLSLAMKSSAQLKVTPSDFIVLSCQRKVCI